ncbi:hypothetical protein VTK73DRAFT_10167 [Phialemonium thermophilum]|uniref:Uncharacterized protein n=1 Tax=Phialemonium thermophilum TaxID=223376 RepID=A0ABR3VY64_9PEZI
MVPDLEPRGRPPDGLFLSFSDRLGCRPRAGIYAIDRPGARDAVCAALCTHDGATKASGMTSVRNPSSGQIRGRAGRDGAWRDDVGWLVRCGLEGTAEGIHRPESILPSKQTPPKYSRTSCLSCGGTGTGGRTALHYRPRSLAKGKGEISAVVRGWECKSEKEARSATSVQEPGRYVSQVLSGMAVRAPFGQK